MSEDDILKLVGILAEGTPAVLSILQAAAAYFKGQGDMVMAKRIEDILPVKSESRAVQEQLEAKAAP